MQYIFSVKATPEGHVVVTATNSSELTLVSGNSLEGGTFMMCQCLSWRSIKLPTQIKDQTETFIASQGKPIDFN